ncbi:NUDIX domain-containing protein [Streptomyces sp. NBC_01443]|uniref:NUDIX domain-containing protein n=2 Tax=unclassified Streptomyces TaxID=2593676 RepID=UPI00225A2658|nr:NUDIX domain-containing protein [Streptomyces sp. NBC_01443]MCX4632863.1 hypothetical protein [Streptomyces sp. NBC_01443]
MANLGVQSAALVLLDGRGQVLLQRRRSDSAGLWSVFTTEANDGVALPEALGHISVETVGVQPGDLMYLFTVADDGNSGLPLAVFAGAWDGQPSSLSVSSDLEIQISDPATLWQTPMEPFLREAVLRAAFDGRWRPYEKRLDPRMAVVVLTDRRGRILLRRRPDTAATWPGAWSYFGAAAKPGETMAAALQRSLTSKGIEVEDLRDLFLISDEATSRKVAVFSGQWPGYDATTLSGHENGDVALVDVEAAEALLVAREARSALRRSLALHGPVGGWDIWDRQPNDAIVPFPPFSSEREFADAVLERLDPHFHIEREVTGTHCSGKPMRIDALARPRAVSAWKDEAPAFGIEFKSPNMPRYGLDPAYTAQALDYTHTDWKGYGRLQVALCPSPLPIHRDEGMGEYRILQSVLTEDFGLSSGGDGS